MLLDRLAVGLQARFSSRYPPLDPPANGSPVLDPAPLTFEEVTRGELYDALQRIPDASPGPDGITVPMIKMFTESPQDLLHIVNYSLPATWIPPDWRLSKVILLPKKPGLGYSLDNIRAISLTSNLVKIIERILLARTEKFLNRNNILSPPQVCFRPGCSIWSAHIDLELPSSGSSG